LDAQPILEVRQMDRRIVGRAVIAAAIGAGLTLGLAPTAVASHESSVRPSALVPVIVTVVPNADPAAVASQVLRPLGGIVGHVYTHALRGFSASLPEALISSLAHEDRIVAIERDGLVQATGTQQPTPSWGIDRIDQRSLPLNSTYTYTSSGVGVAAYVIDTGIEMTHPAFDGRAHTGFDAIDGGAADDCNGHGTHVAGTIGSPAYGVAKEVRLFAVRVLNCQGGGSTSQVIAGIDWVVGFHGPGQPAVANLSLGGGPSTALDNAVRRMVTDGISVVVAAGNGGGDACTSSPARVPEAITVGATTISDARASYSNIGPCLDLFAPGSNITSAWLNGGVSTISGTSMAAPHAAGVAAQYLDAHHSASPATVAGAIRAASTKDAITVPAGGCTLFIFCTPATPNNDLLFTSF